MVDTKKVIGFYTDVFGNEINEYEKVKKYTVWYEGCIFKGDSNGINEHSYDTWEDAVSLYYEYGDMIHITDNEYNLTFEYGDWN